MVESDLLNAANQLKSQLAKLEDYANVRSAGTKAMQQIVPPANYESKPNNASEETSE